MTAPSREQLIREHRKLQEEIKALQQRVDDAESTVNAIRAGEVDAVLVAGERNVVLTLESADQPYRLLVERMTEGAATLTVEGVILSCNQRFADLLGYPTRELAGKRLAAFAAPDSVETVENLCAFAEERSTDVEVSLQRADGRSVHAYISANQVSVGALGACLLMTDRTEQRAHELKARLAAIVETSDDAIVGRDVDGKIFSWNRGAERMFGWAAHEALGQDITLLIPPEQTSEQQRIIERLRRGDPVTQFETVRRRKDGTLVEINLTISPLRDAQGKITGYSTVARDISEQVRTNRALQDADRRKNEFLAMLAHELRSPLATIGNALSVLNVAGDNREAGERAKHMMGRQLEQMVRMIEDLLDVSRISRGTLQLRKSHIELKSVIDDAVAMCRPLMERAQQVWQVVLPPKPVYLYADDTRLSQIFVNLLTNATKYTPERGRIAVVAELAADTVVISVRDSGVGIAPENLEHIFDLYSHFEPPKQNEAGLGIGLTLVKRLVELHGGSVEARSAGLGHGSEFIVRLPLTTDRPLRRRSDPPVTAAGGKRRVLVVDDNRDSADTLAMLLQLSGHETLVAYTAEAGLVAGAEQKPEIVLLDLDLPGLTGYEAAQRIRTEPWGKQAVLVALTGFGHEDDRRRSLDAGFDRHLVKPVNHGELVEVLGLSRSPSES